MNRSYWDQFLMKLGYSYPEMEEFPHKCRYFVYRKDDWMVGLCENEPFNVLIQKYDKDLERFNICADINIEDEQRRLELRWVLRSIANPKSELVNLCVFEWAQKIVSYLRD